MATKAQNLRPSFPSSDLGPCELSGFPCSDDDSSWKQWILWSTYNDELRYHQMPLLSVNGGTFDATATSIKVKIKCGLQELDPHLVPKAYLVQFWGLVNIGDSRYLTTCDQPFALTHGLHKEEDVEGLCRYRKHCLGYLIAVDETSFEEGKLGPPGRVYRSGLPEYLTDVRYYSSKEFPQRDLVVKYVKGYWALPVYQSCGHTCIGVLEFVFPEYGACNPWVKYLDFLKKVGLTTNGPVCHCNYKRSSSCHKREIDKIAKALGVVCKTHQIPVAQTWIEANSKEQLTATCPGSYYGLLDSWFMDAYLFRFIRKGHGVVGKAFSSQSACFCRDIRQLSITEYPFVPNAREYGFSSCFAICLQSSCSNSCVYTLEFLFLTNETNSGDPRTLLLTIMKTLIRHLQSSFKIASGQELGQNLFVEVIKVFSDDKLDSFEISKTTSCESAPKVIEVQNQVGMISPDGSFQQVDAANNSVHDINVQQNVIVGSPPTPELVQNVLSITHRQPIEELNAAILARDDASMEHNSNEVTNLRKKGGSYTLKTELRITREVLEQYSAMKLVDAAKGLGVSRSTLKRICRSYDIHRWPLHKAKKYNQATDRQEIAQPFKKNIEEHSMSVAKKLQDDSSIMVKATYKGVIIKFQLSLSARKMDLDEKVAMRLNLPVESFKIMYLDEEDDWVSITCDEDLSISLSMLRSISKTTIKMLVSQ